MQYSVGRLARAFSTEGRFLDRGEELALALAAGSARGRPVLDLGVGAGRTTSLLALLTDDYVGVDYSEELVKRARAAHPGADLRQGDARHLSAFPRAHYGLVVFSFNGIDNVDHDDRARVLREVHDVLTPGAYFVYSTLNKAGPWFAQTPWRLSQPGPPRQRLEQIARLVLETLESPRSVVQTWSGYWKVRKSVQDHGDWGMAPLGGPGAGLVTHWSTVRDSERELAAAGLQLVAIFDPDGTRRATLTEDTPAPMFHLVARRSADGH